MERRVTTHLLINLHIYFAEDGLGAIKVCSVRGTKSSEPVGRLNVRVFQELCRRYSVFTSLYCEICIASSELRLGMDFKFVFAFGPETSSTRRAGLITMTCLSPFNPYRTNVENRVSS